ncbi:MAG TPA: site-specific DNA-methyltransferase, partial [Helicobacter sp.]|nr:site-specific DNA-methyltransferase [Helicobacter sp.]
MLNECVLAKDVKIINDNFQNFKRYNIPKAQLVIADIPYNLGVNAYASNPSWYIDGDNKNGESKLAGKQFFNSDLNFNIAEFFHFCHKLLKPEPKETNKAGAMIVFCSFEQQSMVIQYAKKHGFKNYINLVFRKNYSSQVLKANMRIVQNCEYGLLLYRDKLPKFNNDGRMIFNCMDWERDTTTPKIHP